MLRCLPNLVTNGLVPAALQKYRGLSHIQVKVLLDKSVKIMYRDGVFSADRLQFDKNQQFMCTMFLQKQINSQGVAC